ncbi:MAG: hypothetical protein JWM19_1838 [Actinomycetia bacterium]|nr:hypothetical protein [Actinomycetes bacterium]
MTSIPNGPLPADVPAAGSAHTSGGLRRFARPPRSSPRAPEERCELCGERVGSEHKHMVDPQLRSIACACTACALLFTRPGGRYRTVPDRVRQDPAAPLTEAEWAELSIPVSVAFFFVNSTLGRVIASYPSPAGVTECELDLAAWSRLADAHPLLRALEPDVEAILVVGGAPHEAVPPQTAAPPKAAPLETAPPETARVEAFLVPIDACYSLAGALRRQWRGFDGGAEVRQIMADLLAGLRQRSRPLDPALTGPAA